MAKTKWTEGRWTFDKAAAQVDCDGGTIAHDIGWAPNGRLIAAAPDLAAALAEVLRIVAARDGEGNVIPSHMLDGARRALARARGEEV